MKNKDESQSVIIIGAGFAGLSAGIYAQMNGYQTRIFEMHDKAGGLCTAWKRKGYTIDGCIHWLVGSKPGTVMYDMWEEVGIVPNRNFVNMDEYTRFIDKEGRNLIFYCDVDKLEHHLLDYAPEDTETIKELTNGIRLCMIFDNPSSRAPITRRMGKWIGMGFIDDFQQWPKTVSGAMIELKNSIKIAGQERAWLNIHAYHHDPGLAPTGKTSVVVMMPTTYDYWKELYKIPDLYKKAKKEIADKIVEAIEETRTDLKGKIEMIDVATPMTFERYTGNWKGSFEGWLITPKNAHTIMKKMPQTINGLLNFYMCGQWVEPGGGLPTSVMSAKRLIRQICKEDKRRFHIAR